jgi:hypothetical protein
MQWTSPGLGCALLALLAATVSSCKKEPEPTSLLPDAAPSIESKPPMNLAPTPGAGGSDVQQHPVAVVWDDPPEPEWSKTAPRGAMRRATYKVPGAKGDSTAAEVAVFYFGPGQGGGVDTNVERWAKQFGMSKDEVKLSNRRVNDEYKPDMMGAGKQGFKDWAMLAAIVEAPSGSYFFKLTGPSETVDQARPVFQRMLDSVKTGL